MRTTRRSLLTFGLLLVLVGFYLVGQGPQVLIPIAEVFGLTSRTQTETPIIAPTLITVAPSSYTFLSAELRSHVQVKGALEVSDAREIAFYVMNQANFSEWRSGRPSAVILAKPFAISYNFTFIPKFDGTYYFIFDNQDTSRRVVLFRLNSLQDRTVLNPVMENAGYEMFALGIILSIVGVKTGRKKPEPKLRAAAGWQCKFCGAENLGDQTFCEKCGRSQH